MTQELEYRIHVLESFDAEHFFPVGSTEHTLKCKRAELHDGSVSRISLHLGGIETVAVF